MNKTTLYFFGSGTSKHLREQKVIANRTITNRRNKFMTRSLVWFLLAAVTLAVSAPLQALTYEVGGCKTGKSYVNFTTISAAVIGVPAGSTIEVCPGVYPEQVTIAQPLTLEGVASGNSARAVIAVPVASGLQPNVTSVVTGVWAGYFAQFAAQVLVQSPGVVNITDITVDGAGANLGCLTTLEWLAGIFYASGSSGTVNHVTTRNQLDQSCGNGIWVENSPPSTLTVTIENSSVHGFDYAGIFVGTAGYDSNLITPIKGNSVYGTGGTYGIETFFVTGTVSGNVVTGGPIGIFNQSGPTLATAISGNTVADTGTGITTGWESGSSVTSNKISNASTGIDLQAIGITASSNTITKTTIAIEFECNTDTVAGNTINDSQIAYDRFPGTKAPAGTLLNVDAVLGAS
jgi:hypothetical protein